MTGLAFAVGSTTTGYPAISDTGKLRAPGQILSTKKGTATFSPPKDEDQLYLTRISLWGAENEVPENPENRLPLKDVLLIQNI